MTTKPEPQPEGKLIMDARKRARLSGREAARRAGISEGRWRQIVNGYMVVTKGVYSPVVGAPADTVSMKAMADNLPEGAVWAGFGNNARDGAEGIMAQPGDAGRPGFTLGTYLHGPLLPRNPHLADYILLCALADAGVTELEPLDDRDEWAAHASFAQRWQQPRQPR